MKIVLTMIAGIALGYGGSLVQSQLLNGNPNQPYADEQGRSISSLSQKDVVDLRAGKGWGLAKPAEFNGYPGPSHVLEFADKLDLEAAQLAAIESSFKAMQAKAKELGVSLIEAEAALDAAFKSNTIDREILKARLKETENVRAQLRAVHLNAHLEITPLLSDAQKTKYAELRGYGKDGHSGHGSH